ncbi:MAG: c-type cytochrome domain-containing protein [Verrucomicrobiota bacterium]
MRSPISIIFALIVSAAAGGAFAREPLAILKAECFRCHTEEKRKGGYVMTSHEALLKGGDTVAAVVPGKPEESFLYELLLEDGDPHMPPKKQLKNEEIAAIERWIIDGAKWDQALIEAIAIPNADVKLTSLPSRYTPISALEVSPDGKRIAFGRGDVVYVWEWFERTEGEGDKATTVSEIRQVAELTGHRDALQSLAWSPDGKALATGGFRQILVWESASWDRVAILEDELVGRVTALAFSNDGKAMISADGIAGFSGRMQIWNAADWTIAKKFDDAHEDTVFDLHVSPDGQLLASGSADKLVKLWKTEDWTPAGFLEGHTGYVLTVCFSPQSDRIASAGDDEQIKVWNLETKKQIHGFTDRLSTGAVTDLIWSMDPAKKDEKPEVKEGEEEPKPFDWLVAVTEDGKPRAYTEFVVHDGTQRSGGARARPWTLAEGFAGALTQIAIAEGQELIVAGTENGQVGVWDLTGKPGDIIFGAPPPTDAEEAGP